VLRDGRPPAVAEAEHEGNPLPERALQLLSGLDGWGLHLSGGGTTVRSERVVEFDGALFGPTDVVGDVHHLPFADDTFELVLCLNAFEHYRDPWRAASEVQRVLAPGGRLLVHTAFLQPVHEAPDHYFNCTRYGLQQWFQGFVDLDVVVSDNFHPGYALAWLSAEAEAALGQAAPDFRAATMGRFGAFWRDAGARERDPVWAALSGLRGSAREGLAAGFELVARKAG
jgi:SAM-dependent methyltransferase